jgi:tetratricopeptide (TPR) repeat protein
MNNKLRSRRSRRQTSYTICIRLLVIGFVFAVFLLLTIPANGQPTSAPIDFSAEQVMGFAHHLFSQQEYFRAIGEYERFLFLYPDDPRAANAALRIVQCYMRGKRWQQAVAAADAFLEDFPQSSLRWQVRLLKARSLGEAGKEEELREEYRDIVKDHPGRFLEAEAWYRIGISYAKEARWLEADRALRRVGSEDLLHGKAEKVRQIVAEESKIKRKAPALAGFLAAIVPGTGHFYCERPRDGTIALVFTGAFGFATYEAFSNDNDGLGVGLALIAAAFYGGNIYSAVNVAHKYNDREERRLQQRLAPYEQMSFDTFSRPVVGISLRFFF